MPFDGAVDSSPQKLAPWEYYVLTIHNELGTPMLGTRVSGAGSDAQWPTAAKNGFGTSTTLNSKVWFTLANGVMTEVFYPTVDMPNVETLQMAVHTGNGVELEMDKTNHRLEVPGPLTFRQINTAKSGQYTITKTYVTDPKQNTVLIDLQFVTNAPAELSIYYDPSLNNSGKYDSGATDGNALLAADGNKASALISDCGVDPQSREIDGNLVQTMRLPGFKWDRLPSTLNCTIALGFGENIATARAAALASLGKGFAATRREYEAGWNAYISRLPRVEARHQRQFNMAAMVLRGLEDKTYRGAVIASPSTPWGGGPNANEPTISGYHAVWSRDLYHVATAFMALDDRETANRLLDYLFRVQQKSDGSFPRNTWVDGRPTGDGLQMDQVALPLVLAYQLGRNDAITWRKHVKPAADFIVKRGPNTDSDRWEEKSGYFPATVAAEIAGLVCAAEIARRNGDATAAETYLKTADEWARKTELIDKARVDAGFLEFVRLGIKAANDKAIVDALKIVDETIRVETPFGDAWYRYNGDIYGETPTGGKFAVPNGVGRLWTLLNGERGEYEIAAGNPALAQKRLDTMARFANDGLMIPEQVWDRRAGPPGFSFGAGTGSATPLAWSMAQFIRLAMNLKHGRNLETPDVVAQRYLSK